MSRFPSLLALVAAMLLPRATTANDAPTLDPAADLYFRGYILNQEATKLEIRGDLLQARDKFQAAAALMAEIAREHPVWQPAMRSQRQLRIQKALLQLQERLSRPGLPDAPV